MHDLFTTLFSDPVVLLRNILRLLHFLGLMLGIGVATMLDLVVLRFFIGKRISHGAFDIFKFGSTIVSVGISVIWLSGLGFLLFYAVFEPIKLTNEKVWAKMIIVLILTLNGIFIHKTILPALKDQIGKTVFEGRTMAERRTFVFAGTTSVVSWYAPLIIASLSSLNFKVPVLEILAAYAIFFAFVLAMSNLVLAMKFAPSSDLRGAQKRTKGTRQPVWR